jgi:glutathione S-transferase
VTKRYRHLGWRASPYTAKTRAYFAARGVPWEDVQPHLGQLLAITRRRVGRIVMPVVITPAGEALQDSTAIIDRVEGDAGAPSVYPDDPTQALAALLLELYADEWMPVIIMYTRWRMSEENRVFIHDEFGRSMLPGFPRWMRDRAGAKTAAAMSRYLPLLGVHPQTEAPIRAWAEETLAALDAQLIGAPFLFGGRPSVADFALYGPIYAHFWRDPGSRPMAEAHPALMRWVRALTDGAAIDGVDFDAGRDLSALAPLFGRLFDEMWPMLTACAAGVAAWAQGKPTGTRIPRAIGESEITIGGVAGSRKLITFPLWMAQRPVTYWASLPPEERAAAAALLPGVKALDALTGAPALCLREYKVALAPDDERHLCLPASLTG